MRRTEKGSHINKVIIGVWIVGSIIGSFALGVKCDDILGDSVSEQPKRIVLEPKHEMRVNEVSKNTVVITNLDFEDAVIEIEKSYKALDKNRIRSE